MATITFDRINNLIQVSTNDTAATVQELYDAIRDYEDEPNNLDLDPIVSGSGKEVLSATEQVGITVTLLNDWRISFGDRGASTNVISCVVSGGNLVAINSFGNNPIYPTLYTQVELRQSQAPTLLTAGSGLDSTQSLQLGELYDLFGLSSGVPLFVAASTRTAGTIGQVIAEDSTGGVTVTRST